MKKEGTHKYDDIINLPHPVSRKHTPMDILDRAAQFSPFAALTGYEDAVKETARLTENRMELDENSKEKLDMTMQMLRRELAQIPGKQLPEASFTFFEKDQHKEGGAYVTVTGIVKKIDEYERKIFFLDGTSIPLEEVVQIELITLTKEY